MRRCLHCQNIVCDSYLHSVIETELENTNNTISVMLPMYRVSIGAVSLFVQKVHLTSATKTCCHGRLQTVFEIVVVDL